MTQSSSSGKPAGNLMRFAIYLLVVVLINIAGITLFYRWDLTADKVYSISDVSKEVVATLAEPLTINVFFTKDLPPPHNNTERYLHDLLSEYAINGNTYFNYKFSNVSSNQGTDAGAGTQANQQLADNYGIRPVQIQAIDNDEVKFQKAYMGLVIIHGDLIERIPTITSTDGLEYRLTTAIQKLNNKISALAALENKVDIKLYMSSSLEAVAPFMRLEQFSQLPDQLRKVVTRLNGLHFDKLVFHHLDPSKDAALAADVKTHQLLTLDWPDLDNGKVAAGSGSIGLVLDYNGQSVTVPLLQVVQLPLIGNHYELADMAQMDEIISKNLESLIDINTDLGYLASHGTMPLEGAGAMPRQAPADGETFRNMASQNYSLKPIDLTQERIPDSLNAMIIAGPTETFNDYELLQIDQFLMKGKNLGIFLDAFKEERPGGQQNMMMPNQQGQFVPLNTGLEKLLAHYGVRISPAIVMDENSYKQRVPEQFGGGEQSLYFAPVIKNANINDQLAFIENIKGLVALEISPLELDPERIKTNELDAQVLFSSSKQAWEMGENITLNPMMQPPPPPADERRQYPLAYQIQGTFKSYFDGKPLPEKPVQNDQAGEAEKAVTGDKEADTSASQIKGSGQFIAESKPGKIILIASRHMISDSLLDEEGRGPNAILAMNILDTLNSRDEIAVMRSKQQQFNPLADTSAGLRTIVKAFNIAGLPVLVVFFGLLVWMRRHGRKNRIRMMFES